jgi:DNA-binding response OmpR family regulator
VRASSYVVCMSPGEFTSPAHSARDLGEIDADLRDVRILVIEDEVMIAWTLESLLEEMGFKFIELAPNAKSALTSAERRPPGLIVSDINLGHGPDGIEATQAILRSSSPAVVFVSGYAGPDARERIGRDIAGAVILSKPVSYRELRTAIVTALREARPH